MKSTFRLMLLGFAAWTITNVLYAQCVAVSISSQPQNKTVSTGSTTTFSVSVNGTAPFLYFWYKNGVQISGANSSSYTTPTLAASDNGNTYKCLITNCNSQSGTTSNTATLTVNTPCTGVTISSQPQNKTVASGSTATFSVIANGTAPILYFWYKNGAQISGATNSTYTTPTLTAADNGNTYYCNLVNCNYQNGTTSSTATLTVNTPCTGVTISSQPQNKTVASGSTATFSVIANGTAPILYFWYKNGAQISGATNSTYTTPTLTAADNGNTYYCNLVNCNYQNGTTSSSATLTVTGGTCTPVTISLQPQNQTVASGSTATFSVTANGTAPILYFWYKNGVQISGATSFSYTTPFLTAADNGNTYYCNLANCNNQNGATSSTALLTITGGNCTPVTISSQPQNQTVASGSTATFSVTANGTLPILYFWYKNGIQISGANSSSYTTIKLNASDNGNTYHCLLVNCNNQNGVTSNTASITVAGGSCTPVTISSQPQNKTLASGGTATFSVSVNGTGPFNYTWYKNNSQIPGANNSSYSTGQITASDNGSKYKCIITNCNGANQIESNIAVVTVIGVSCNQVTFTSQPQSQIIPVGYSAVFSVSIDGTGPFTYSWYKNNSQIPGASSSSYYTDQLTLSDNGNSYKCIVKNCNNSNQVISNNAILTVKGADNSITFFHQIENSSNRYFRIRHLLFNSQTGLGNPQICADGSNSTVIRFASVGSTIMKSLNFKIKENIDDNDAENFGIFNLIQRYPDSMVYRYTHPLVVANDGLKRTITLQIINNDNKEIIKELPMDIYRAPVLMVHGLWSDGNTFNDMEDYLYVHYYPISILRKANYQSTNDRSLDENSNVVPDEITNLLIDALNHGFSSGKVDIIGHSMGGLLARKYIQSSIYNNNINRLITINTPHSGSQFANLLLKKGSILNLIIANIRVYLELRGKCVDCGAINDLQINSKAIEDLRLGELRSPSVPKRSIITTTLEPQGNGWDSYLTNLYKLFGLKSPLYNILGYEDNDLIVPKSSQIGGLTSSYYTYDFKNISHTSATSNPNNINEIVELLKKNPNDAVYFTKASFNPPFLSEGVFGKTLSKSVSVKTNDSIAINITSPPIGTIVNPGQLINVTVSSKGEINKLLFVATTQQGNIFSEVIEDSSAIFQYRIPDNANGVITIFTMGSGDSGSIGIDSIKLNATISTSLDSISIYPKLISLPKGQKANISIKGYFSDGVMRDIGSDPNINSISSDPFIVKMLSPVSLSADSIGFADLNIAYFGKTDHISIVVLPADAFATTNIDENKNEIMVSGFELIQNYPNPFNPITTIKFILPKNTSVKLIVYDVLGRQIRTLVEEQKPAGSYRVEFSADNLSSGVYFYRLQTEDFVQTKKLILVK